MAEVKKFKKRAAVAEPELTKKGKPKSTKPKGEGKANPGNRYVGATSGLGVTEYQNKTILTNPKHKRTDEEIAKDWRKEFPKAKAYTAEDVAGVRNVVNKGKHGNDAPVKPVHGYDDAGEALPLRGEKSAAKAAKKASKAAKTPVKLAGKKAKAVVNEDDEEEVEEDEEEVEEVDDDEAEEEDAAEVAPKRRRVAK